MSDPPAGTRLFEVRDPATEAVIERLEPATAQDADAAVARAAAAFEGWRAVAPADRGRLLRRLAGRLRRRRDRLGAVPGLRAVESLFEVRDPATEAVIEPV